MSDRYTEREPAQCPGQHGAPPTKGWQVVKHLIRQCIALLDAPAGLFQPRSGNLQGKRYRTLQVGLYHRASVGLEHSQTGHLVDTHAAPGPGAAAHAVGIHVADMRLRTATR